MKIRQFHYITTSQNPTSLEAELEQVLNAGVEWIQIRLKADLCTDIDTCARIASEICKDKWISHIMNDHVELAAKYHYNGVHLGKKDMATEEARRILGRECVIGRTANSLADIKQLSQDSIDYVGVGPFRHTTTKKVLEPTLGLAGYREIMNQLPELKLPIIAIGGIIPKDVESLMSVGVHGIAVASGVWATGNVNEQVDAYKQSLQCKMTV